MTLGAMMIPAAGAKPLVDWDDGAFANTSADRWISVGKALYGPFGANVPAIATIGGKRYYQSEAAATNAVVDIDSWVVGGSPTITGGQADPAGGTGAFKIEGLTTGDYLYDTVTAGAAGAAIAASVFIKRIDTTGTIDLHNAQSASLGDWTIDLSLLSDDWERITSVHPAVTVAVPFVNNGSGNGGLWFRGGATPRDFYAWYPQHEEADYPSSPIAPGVTRAADSMTFTAAQVPTRMREGKWKVDVMPHFASADLTAGDAHQVFWWTGGDKLLLQHAAGIVRANFQTNSVTLAHGAVAFSRDQKLTLTPDVPGEALTVAGATSGDGTSTGTVVAPPDGTLNVGTTGAATQFNGLIAEPEAA